MKNVSKEQIREMRRQLARQRDLYLFLTDTPVTVFRRQVQELCKQFTYLPKTQAELLATAHAIQKLREMQAQQDIPNQQQLYASSPQGEYEM